MNYYRAYGLHVETELVLDELVEISPSSDERIDLRISYGKMPVSIIEAIQNEQRSQYTQEEIWFHVKKIGTFRILCGNEIIIEMSEEVEEERVHQFIYGRCFAFTLLQRNILTLHSSTIQIGDEAIVLVGESGVGKSTLSSHFLLDGHGFVCDDVSRIEKINQNHYVIPAFPVQRLHENVMKCHGNRFESYKKIDYELGKVIHFISHHEIFSSHPVSLRAIFELTVDETATSASIEMIKGKDKLQTVYQHIFGSAARYKAGLNASYFKKCIELTKDIPLYRIKRPVEGDTAKEQKELIYQLLEA